MDVVIVRGDTILLGRRTAEPCKGSWALIGGFVEWDETVEEALARETLEESHLTVTAHTLIGVYSNPSRHSRQAISVAYAVEVEGEPIAGDDIAELAWYPLDALPELAFDHVKIIADHLAAR